MTKKEKYMQFHQECCNKMVEITKKKNADYTGTIDDPFANFRLCEAANVASVMQGFLVRMLDKLARINSFAQKGFMAVAEETVTDTLLDLANYCILLAGFIRSESEDTHTHKKEEVWGGKNAKAPEKNA